MSIQSASFHLCFLTIRRARSDSSCAVLPMRPPLQRSNRCRSLHTFSDEVVMCLCGVHRVRAAAFVSYCRSSLSAVPTQRSRWPPSPFVLFTFALRAPLRAGFVHSHFCLFYYCSPHHFSFCLDNMFTSFLIVSCAADSQLGRTQTATSATKALQFQLSACFSP